jgi:tetratricopeptide (TPR) repeat protein
MRVLAILLLFPLLVAAAPGGCKTTPPTAGSAGSATAMGHWSEWMDLTPLVAIAENHASKITVKALESSSLLLREGKAHSADARLAEHADGDGRHWIAVARADLAALHFTVCIRGVALRLEDEKPTSITSRRMDFSEDTRIEPGDVSIEAMLTNVDAAMESDIAALVTQARIARARVTAFASRCAPNDDVARMAQGVLEADLATLAAEGHLTPDLAYLWAGVQMNKFSGAAARPFLLRAIDGGFDDPSAIYMLALIALDQRELERADELAQQAIAAYAEIGDDMQRAQGHFIRGEVARARKQPKAAREHYDAALKLVPTHIAALLAVAELIRDKGKEDAARDYLHDALPRLLLDGELDATSAKRASSNVEAMVIMAEEPHLALLGRDALLQDIDAEPDPMRRGIRYFYAATLDVRLGEYELSHCHGVLAKEEFASVEVPPPVDVEAFLERLRSAG